MINLDEEFYKKQSKLINEIEEEYRPKWDDSNVLTSEAFKGFAGNVLIFLAYHYHLPFEYFLNLPLKVINEMIRFANGERLDNNKFKYDMEILKMEKEKVRKRLMEFDEFLLNRDRISFEKMKEEL